MAVSVRQTKADGEGNKKKNKKKKYRMMAINVYLAEVKTARRLRLQRSRMIGPRVSAIYIMKDLSRLFFYFQREIMPG